MPEKSNNTNSKTITQLIFDVVKTNSKQICDLSKKFDDFVNKTYDKQIICMSRFTALEQQKKTEDEITKQFKNERYKIMQYRKWVIGLLVTIVLSIGSAAYGFIQIFQVLRNMNGS